MSLLSTFVSTAIGQVGYQAGADYDNKYGVWFGENNVPWCAIFVAWCASTAGNQTNAATAASPYVYDITASVQTLYTWYGDNNRALAINNTNPSSANYPKVGDIAFINGTATHCGIIVEVTSTTITTVEGDYDSGVAEVTYQMSTLMSGSNVLSYLGNNN